MKTLSRTSITWIILAAVLIGPQLPAEVYLYGLNAVGKTFINGNQVDRLPGDFDTDYPGYNTEESWADLLVDGSDRYALRRDGVLAKNGVKVAKFPYDDDDGWYWTSMAIDTGTIFAIKQNGQVYAGGLEVAKHKRGDFYFTRLVRYDGNTYALRSDGNVYRNNEEDPLFKFRAGEGVWDENDGRESDTLWVDMMASPLAGPYIYALRADGSIFRGNLDNPIEAGEIVIGLPYPNDSMNYSKLYWTFAFDGEGKWMTIQRNGTLYREPTGVDEVIDFQGSGDDDDNTFLDLLWWNGYVFALRSDGRVYADLLGPEDILINQDGGWHVKFAVSTEPPTFSDDNNSAPFVTKVKVTRITGQNLRLPIIVTDAETHTEDLIITPELPLPEGSAYDAETRTFLWNNVGPKGNYTFAFTVNDGTNKPKTYKYKVKVKDPDDKPDKNKKPYLPKFKKPVAMAKYEFRLPIITADPDGDPVSVTADHTIYPFNAGAYYEISSGDFVWTPDAGDIGKFTVPLVISDGENEKTLKIKLEVRAPLIPPDLPVDEPEEPGEPSKNSK